MLRWDVCEDIVMIGLWFFVSTYNSDAQRTVNNIGYIRYLSLSYRGHIYPANFAGYPCVLLCISTVDVASKIVKKVA